MVLNGSAGRAYPPWPGLLLWCRRQVQIPKEPNKQKMRRIRSIAARTVVVLNSNKKYNSVINRNNKYSCNTLK